MSQDTTRDPILDSVDMDSVRDPPNAEEFQQYLEQLTCFHVNDDHKECAQACPASDKSILERHMYLHAGGWADKLLHALGHMRHRNRTLIWDKITQVITETHDEQTAHELRTATDALVHRLNNPTAEITPAPSVVPPHAGAIAVQNTNTQRLLEKIAEIMLSNQETIASNHKMVNQLAKRNDEPVAVASFNPAGITIDAPLQFHGYTEKGREDFQHWLTQFEDRGVRLNWTWEDFVKNFIAAQTGDARIRFAALQAGATKEMQPMFKDDWPATRKWACTTYGIAGPTYFINMRLSGAQAAGETFDDFLSRHSLEMSRFYTIYQEYINGQLISQARFLMPQEAVKNPFLDRAFTEDDTALIEERDRTYSTANKADRLHLLTSWRVADCQRGVTEANKDLWNNYIKITQWINLNHRVIDGLAAPAVRTIAYKEREKRFQSDLADLGYYNLSQNFRLFLVKAEDLTRSKPSIYSHVAEINSQVDANKAGWTKKKKTFGRKKAKIHEITTEAEATQFLSHNRQPKPANVAETRSRTTAGAAGAAMYRNKKDGESFEGPDGLTRTAGATCTRCGYKGHKAEHCAKNIAEASAVQARPALQAIPNGNAAAPAGTEDTLNAYMLALEQGQQGVPSRPMATRF